MKHWLTLLTGFALLSAAAAYADDQQQPLNTGQDFTRPLTRFDIRQKYQDLPGAKEAYTTTLRMDKPIVLNKEGWVLGLRMDAPFVVSDVVSRDNPNSAFKTGASDLLGQFVLIAPQGQKKWTYGVGAQLIFPSASEDQMGSGRYQVAPLVGVKLDMNDVTKGSFGWLLLREHIDAGGDSTRTRVGYTVIQPGFNLALPRDFFVTIAPEIRVDWENESRWFVPFDITLGKMLNKSTVVSIEYKTPIVDNKYPMYNNEVEARIGFFF